MAASKCRILEAGYRRAAAVTNESISGQAVKRSQLFFDRLDLASSFAVSRPSGFLQSDSEAIR
jgi:hypothetical protein